MGAPTVALQRQGTEQGDLAVVVVHGIPQHPRANVVWLEGLEMPSYLACMPGYAGVAAPSLPYDFVSVALALEDAILAAHDGPVALIGMSGGCYRVMQVALGGRVPVAGMCLLGPVDGLASVAEKQGFREFAALVRRKVDLSEAFLHRSVSAQTVRTRPELAGQFREWLGAVSPAVLAAELEAFAGLPLLRSRLGTLDVPTILRVGEHDEAAPPHYAQAIAAALPQATLTVVSGAGHSLVFEDAEATKAAIHAWLAELSTAC